MGGGHLRRPTIGCAELGGYYIIALLHVYDTKIANRGTGLSIIRRLQCWRIQQASSYGLVGYSKAGRCIAVGELTKDRAMCSFHTIALSQAASSTSQDEI